METFVAVRVRNWGDKKGRDMNQFKGITETWRLAARRRTGRLSLSWSNTGPTCGG